jgi:hypothetical protein
VDHPLPWLKYVDAGDLNDDEIALDGMAVETTSGDKVGSVEGFIVDSQSGRPYYVAVDAGGWFKSKHFLLPVGHARVTTRDDREALVADVPRERIERFPGFDLSEFEKLTPDTLKRMNDETCAACSVTSVSYAADEPFSAAWQRPDYSYPDWWSSEPSLPDRMGDTAFKAGVSYPSAGESHADRGQAHEQVTARDRAESEAEREGRDADPSPYYDGRAQPGDVIGLETGGEQTHIGETREDENERRRDAEKDASRLRD